MHEIDTWKRIVMPSSITGCGARGDTAKTNAFVDSYDRAMTKIFILGKSKTRAVAAYDAVSDCRAPGKFDLVNSRAMNLDADPQGEWGSRVSAERRVTQCYGTPPPAAGRGRRMARVAEAQR